MSAGASTKAGQAWWEIGLKDVNFKRGIKAAEEAMSSWAGKIAAVSGVLTGGAVIGFFRPVLSEAARAQQVLTKFRSVFGESSQPMQAWSDRLADALNRSRTDVRKFTAETQQALEALSLDPGKSQVLTKALTKLGVDLASSFGAPDEEAFTAITSAINGENEALKKFKIVATEASVKQVLMAKGMKNVQSNATEQEKALARVIFILSQSGRFQGYAATTSDLLANAWKGLRKSLLDLQGSLGARAADLFGPFVKKVADVVRGTSAWVRNNDKALTTLTKIAAATLAFGVGLTVIGTTAFVMAQAFSALGAALSVIATTGKVAALVLTALTSPWLLIAAGVGAVVFVMLSLMRVTEGAKGSLVSLLNAVGATIGPIVSNITQALEELVEGFVRGDVETSWRILMSTMALEYNKFLSQMASGMLTVANVFKNGFLTISAYAKMGLSTVVSYVGEWVRNLKTGLDLLGIIAQKEAGLITDQEAAQKAADAVTKNETEAKAAEKAFRDRLSEFANALNVSIDSEAAKLAGAIAVLEHNLEIDKNELEKLKKQAKAKFKTPVGLEDDVNFKDAIEEALKLLQFEQAKNGIQNFKNVGTFQGRLAPRILGAPDTIQQRQLRVLNGIKDNLDKQLQLMKVAEDKMPVWVQGVA